MRPLARASPVHPVPDTRTEWLGLSTPLLDACRSASLQVGGPTLKRLGLTSAIRGEGRSTVALAMAMIQARDYGRRAILVDLDLEHQGLARRLDLKPWPGLCEMVRGEASIPDVLQPVVEGVRLISAGATAGAAARVVIDLLGGKALGNLADTCDVIVVDLPPLLGSSFGRLAAGSVERVILVVRAGVTPLARVREAAAQLPSEPAVLLNATYSSIPGWFRRMTGGTAS